MFDKINHPHNGCLSGPRPSILCKTVGYFPKNHVEKSKLLSIEYYVRCRIAIGVLIKNNHDDSGMTRC